MKIKARALLDSMLSEVYASNGRCPACGGPGRWLGARGDDELFECNDCGEEFTEEDAAKAEKKKEEKEE